MHMGHSEARPRTWAAEIGSRQSKRLRPVPSFHSLRWLRCSGLQTSLTLESSVACNHDSH